MPILDKAVLPEIEVKAESSDASSTMISTTGIPNQTIFSSDSEDIHLQIIHAEQNEQLEDFIKVLQLMLKESREPIRTQMNIMQERGMTLTRACFAVIVKLAGLSDKLEFLLQEIELRDTDFDAEEPQERLVQMKDAVKEM